MNLKEQIKKHEDSIEILEFLDFLERHEAIVTESNVNFKKWSGKDLSYYPWKCQVIKRARNYAVNKYNRLNK